MTEFTAIFLICSISSIGTVYPKTYTGLCLASYLIIICFRTRSHQYTSIVCLIPNTNAVIPPFMAALYSFIGRAFCFQCAGVLIYIIIRNTVLERRTISILKVNTFFSLATKSFCIPNTNSIRASSNCAFRLFLIFMTRRLQETSHSIRGTL